VKIDVLFGVQQLTPQDVQGRVVAMIDVLRASSTIAVALANGARAIIPLESSEDVVTRSKQFERAGVLLAGERRMLKMDGFDLGNSPVEHSRAAVEGKTVLLTTTNGTRALLAVQGARVVCAGQDRQFALEDAACAGRYVYQICKRIQSAEMNDAALAASLIDRKYGDNLMRLFQTAAHGRALAAAGFEEDLAACAVVDSYPVIPISQDRHITKLGPERER
jgi:2-phosphosulfolactate phosphatase